MELDWQHDSNVPDQGEWEAYVRTLELSPRSLRPGDPVKVNARTGGVELAKQGDTLIGFVKEISENRTYPSSPPIAVIETAGAFPVAAYRRTVTTFPIHLEASS